MGPCWFHHLHILPAGGAETFLYTRQGRCAAGIDDAADLDNTRHAFNLLGTVLVGHGWGTPWGVGRAGPHHPTALTPLLVGALGMDTPVLGSPDTCWLFPSPQPAGCGDPPPALGAAPHAPAVPAGVPEADQLELFSVLAAILHLGDIAVRGRDRHGDGCFVEVGESLLCPATLGPASRRCW